MTQNPFDQVAPDYEKVHNRNLPPGVSSDEFVTQKAAKVVEWITYSHKEKDFNYLDFGCGNGRLFKHLLASPALQPLIAEGRLQLFGFDTSKKSLEEAGKITGDSRVCFFSDFNQIADEIRFDLIICCNVFHHIVPAARDATIKTLGDRMARNARLALWEHNPYNPFTRLIVKTCPFDADAHLLTLNSAITLFQRHSFHSCEHAYVNIFPPKLQRFKTLSAIENTFAQTPIGAQYFVIFGREEEPADYL